MRGCRNSGMLTNKVLLYSLVLGFLWPEVSSIEFKQWGSKVWASACSTMGWECCRPPFVRETNAAMEVLQKRLEEEFFGQHLAAQVVVNALRSHLQDEDSNKALVLSFHGWAGSGKTYLAELIMKSLYQDGPESQYVKFYMASYHFPDPNDTKVVEYQDKLREDVESVIKKCDRGLFVFDEVDKTPPKVFDTLVPFIQHPGKKFQGHNFKRSIFIFLSNIGANDITKITFKNWKDGRRREDLKFTDFEGVLQKEAFNKQNTGFSKSRILDKILVDFFIPFLPMERKHILSCVKIEIQRVGAKIDPESVVESLAYWPPNEKLYSQSGCKKVENLVKYYDMQEKYDQENKHDRNTEHDEF